jgi:hypothetical protein
MATRGLKHRRLKQIKTEARPVARPHFASGSGIEDRRLRAVFLVNESLEDHITRYMPQNKKLRG